MKHEVQVNIRCPVDLLGQIDEIAEALGVARSEVVRRALAVYVAQAAPVIADVKAGRGGIWSYIFGPPIRSTGDETDEQMVAALTALTREMKKRGNQREATA
jgi:hypothetical protein